MKYFTLPLDEQATLTTLLSQPYRYYHNINHVNDCLAELYKWYSERQGSFENLVCGTYFCWYHDIVYNPYFSQGLNEQLSSTMFTNTRPVLNIQGINWYNTNPLNQRTEKAILATTHHTITQYTLEFFEKLMLDIDLAGMGKSPEIFNKNSLNIRKEYYNNTDKEVVEGRYKFFTELNKRESFYYTEYFKDLYHEQSKNNVMNELVLLEDAINMKDYSVYFNEILRIASPLII